MTEEKVPFKKNQVKLAVGALLAYVKKENENKKKTDLFEGKQGLWLSVGLRKIPATQIKPTLVPLPHPCHDISGEVCFISSQPGKDLKKSFQEKGITNVHKVISLTKLRKEYKTYTLKRQLIAAYDVFLCEEKIYNFVCKSLGKECYKHKKEPIPVRMRYSDIKKEVDKCISSSLLRIGHGPNSSLLVGNIEQHKEKQVMENLVHAMRIVGKKMPGKWDNIKSMYLKTATSVALPLYQASPVAIINLDDVKSDEQTEKRRKRKPKVDPTLKNTDPSDLDEDEISQVVDEAQTETVLDEPITKKKKTPSKITAIEETVIPLDETTKTEEPIKKKKKVTSKVTATEETKTEGPIKKKKKVTSKVTVPEDTAITLEETKTEEPIKNKKKTPSKVTAPKETTIPLEESPTEEPIKKTRKTRAASKRIKQK